MDEQTNKIRLRGGVLIIGSLFWEDETNCLKGQETKGRMRKHWRDHSLNLQEAKSVKMPTRYGRLSSAEARQKTYTMVLSKDYIADDKLGTGIAAPFLEVDFDYGYFKKQAIELAKAEGIFDIGARMKLGVSFSGIAIWINSNSPYKYQVEDWWSILRSDRELPYDYSAAHYTWKDGTLLTEDFKLSLELKDCDLDFSFCTYIRPRYKPKHKGNDVVMEYPEAKEIANAMIENGYYTYFRENANNGILTYDDPSIELLIANINLNH